MFQDRREAGRLLAKLIGKEIKSGKTIVCGITRGGVIVALEISRHFHLPLYPIIVKKIGAPDNPELALGAVTYNKTVFIDWELSKRLGASASYLEKQTEIKTGELMLLAEKFRRKKRIPIKNKNIILVDDGVATGTTVLTALKYLKKRKAAKVILAVPVIAGDTYAKLQKKFDQVLALEISDDFLAVGQFYQSFPQVSDKEILTLIN